MNVADRLTKPLEKDTFNAFRDMLKSINGLGGIYNINAPKMN